MKSIHEIRESIICFALISVSTVVVAQIQIDKKIQLTGNNAGDAKIEGIQQVSAAQDAVSAEAVQKNTLTYGSDTGSGNIFSVSLTPAPAAYTEGMEIKFKSSLNITGAAQINVNGLGAKSIKKNVNDDIEACDIISGQIVTLIYDGTYFQVTSPLFSASPSDAIAGPDQSVSGGTTTLAGNDPSPGTGIWTIESGIGGSLGVASSYNSSFSGTVGNTYTLRWTVTNDCGVSDYDELNITFNVPVSRVFVTASFGSGDLNSWSNSGGLTGLAAGDRICKYDTNNPAGAGNGNWTAFLSTTTLNAKDRIIDAEYQRPGGVVIANNKADLTDGTLDNPIIDSPVKLIYTGSDASGVHHPSPSPTADCSGWTSSANLGVNASIGKATQANSEWAVYTYNYGCTGTSISEGGNKLYLYCFEY
ncbi:MAG: DUF1554 domain-containing protein [Crocinitomicaceae bacterium]|nr:DUF1554 domain-containing protein [Crocinitomicaceae bacterium]